MPAHGHGDACTAEWSVVESHPDDEHDRLGGLLRASPVASQLVLPRGTDRGAESISLGMRVDDIEVRALFRQAIAHDDESAMRQGIESVLGLSDGSGLSAEQEYAVRHPDYVMEMPQSNERVRGRDAMRAMQEAFPTPPGVRLRRVHGSGRTWVVEGVNDYNGDVWNVVLILELDDDGRIIRDTRYYGQRSAPPEWRSRWVEPIE
jgi:hypothetical protein